jgi:quaternary ammonium compound-resistance protein SugE
VAVSTGNRGEAAVDWLLLVCAGIFEIGWAVGLKYTAGFTRITPSILTLCAMLASITLLGAAVRTIPIGTGYAIWTGIGAVGAAMFGIIALGESAGVLRLGCIALVVAGIVGLKLTSD